MYTSTLPVDRTDSDQSHADSDSERRSTDTHWTRPGARVTSQARPELASAEALGDQAQMTLMVIMASESSGIIIMIP